MSVKNISKKNDKTNNRSNEIDEQINNKNITKEEWLAFLHSLHKEIRDSKSIKLTGIPALNEISNFLLLYFTDKNGLIKKEIDKGKLKNECSFEYLYNEYASDKKISDDRKKPDIVDKNSYKLWHMIYDTHDDDIRECVLQQLINNDFFKKYLVDNVTRISAYINRKDAHQTIQSIFKIIHDRLDGISLTYQFYDAFGSAYEQFKTDEVSNAGKRTGQHFTPIAIKELIVTELKPKYNELYYEPCAGSGGFIHTMFSYVNKNDENKKNHEIFKNNIFANECNPEITKSLMINMLLHSIPINNIHEKDSLSKTNLMECSNKFDIIATNPPFGMHTDLDDDEYWKPIKTGKNIIKDSLAQFLVHVVNSLKVNGRAGVVIDRGILNNGSENKNNWQSSFRKWLLDNVNVYKIIYLPTGIFDYTNFATAVIFFIKGEKTKDIHFYLGKFSDVKNKKGFSVDNTPFKILTNKEIIDNNYCLKVETEEKKEIKKLNCCEWVKLGDVCNIIKGKALTIDKMTGTLYKVIGGGYTYMNDYMVDIANTEEKDILMSNDGAYAGYINMFKEKMFITSHCNKIIVNEKYNKMYLYYYLKMNQDSLLKSEELGGYQKGQAQPSINSQKLKEEFLIPSLPLEHQQEIVSFLDEQFEKYDINKLSEVIKDVPIFNLLIKKKYEDFADLLHLIYRKLEANSMQQHFERDKKTVFKFLVQNVKYVETKLEDIIEIQNLKTLKIENAKETGKYPFYNCSIIDHKWSNDYQYDDEVLIMNRINGSGKYKIFYNNGKFSITNNLLIFKVKKNDIKFIKEYIENHKNNFEKIFEGGDKKYLNQTKFLNEKINLPSLNDQEKIVKEIEEIEKQQLSYKNYGELLQKQLENIFNLIKNMDNHHDKIVEQDAYKCDGDLINLDNKQTEQTHDELKENHSIVNTNINKEHISKSNKLNPNKILDNAVKDNMKNIKEPIKQQIKKSNNTVIVKGTEVKINKDAVNDL